jgi:hypothetical protein
VIKASRAVNARSGPRPNGFAQRNSVGLRVTINDGPPHAGGAAYLEVDDADALYSA